MRSIAIVIGLIALTGCTEAVRSYDGDGNEIQTVACVDNQLVGGLTSCLKEANKACPDGYKWQGGTDHPVPWQITKMPERDPADDLPGFAPSIVSYSDRMYGYYTRSPRLVNRYGGFQYITIKCK